MVYEILTVQLFNERLDVYHFLLNRGLGFVNSLMNAKKANLTIWLSAIGQATEGEEGAGCLLQVRDESSVFLHSNYTNRQGEYHRIVNPSVDPNLLRSESHEAEGWFGTTNPPVRANGFHWGVVENLLHNPDQFLLPVLLPRSDTVAYRISKTNRPINATWFKGPKQRLLCPVDVFKAEATWDRVLPLT
jgi:hypothetical protein